MRGKVIATIGIGGLLLLSLMGCQSSKKAPDTFKCSNKTVQIEYGSNKEVQVSDFVKAKKEVLKKVSLKMNDDNIKEVGTYHGNIVYQGTKYPIRVVVKDTTSPEVLLQNYVKVKAKSKLSIRNFMVKTKDFSETQVGFVTGTLTTEKVSAKDLKQYKPMKSPQQYGEEQKTFTVGTKGKIKRDFLKETMVLNKPGCYQVQVAAVDTYGNASTYMLHVTVASSVPKITYLDNYQLDVKYNKKGNLVIQSQEGIKQIKITDEIDGDITKKAKITFNHDPRNPIATYEVTNSSGETLKVSRKVPINQTYLRESKKDYEAYQKDVWNRNVTYPSNAEQKDLLAAENNARGEKELTYLTYDKSLAKKAAKRAKEIAKSFKISNRYGVENIVRGDEEDVSGTQVFHVFMKNNNQKNHVLNGSYTKTGIAYYIDKDYVKHWVQIFQ